MKIGLGFDVHELVEGRPLILGGVSIPHKKGLQGHSDADVLLHALMDALLGALALGDLGSHFPDTDSTYQDANSMVLLNHVGQMVRERQFQLGNLDAVIVAQRPKIAPFIPEMRHNISDCLQLGIDCVSIKATTTERLGFVGREEGIAAQAVVLLEKIGSAPASRFP